MNEGISFKITSDYVGARNLFSPTKKKIIFAYIESHDDHRFWDNALQSKKIVSDNIKLKFKAPSLAGNANGKNTLIRMYTNGEILLGKNLIICLDSDYDYLIGQEEGSSKHFLYNDEFVFQTYSYSTENHYYTTEGLNAICERAVCGNLDVEFCIHSYVSHWSSVIYDVFCKLLFLKKIGKHEDFKNETKKLKLMVKSNFNGNLNISKLGSIMIKFEKDVEYVRESIKKINFDNDLYIEFVENLTKKGLHSKNTHMFFQGHDFEDLFIKPLCVSISKRIVSRVTTNLRNNNQGKVRLDLINAYHRNTSDVISCIKNRALFEGNLFFEWIVADFDRMCNKFH